MDIPKDQLCEICEEQFATSQLPDTIIWVCAECLNAWLQWEPVE